MSQFSILFALNLLGLALIFFYVRGKVRKTLELDGLVERLRSEVGDLVRDLNQTTDRNVSLVEDSLVRLRDAFAEADKKIVVFRRETERRTAETQVYDRLGKLRSAPAGGDKGSTQEPVTVFPKPQPVSTPQTPAPPSVEPDRESATAIPFVTFSSSPIRPKPPVKEEVMSLSRRGISPDFIAAKLGITVAEVELIVSLEEQKGLLSREEGL